VGNSKAFVGIDVSKSTLDVAVHGSVERWSLSNDEQGIAKLASWAKKLKPALVTLEAPLAHALVTSRDNCKGRYYELLPVSKGRGYPVMRGFFGCHPTSSDWGRLPVQPQRRTPQQH